MISNCHDVVAPGAGAALHEEAGHGLGLSAAALQFNRKAAVLVALTRRWTCVPARGFFDGFKVHDLACLSCAAQVFRELVVALGLGLDPQKSSGLSPKMLFLGVEEDYSGAVCRRSPSLSSRSLSACWPSRAPPAA